MTTLQMIDKCRKYADSRKDFCKFRISYCNVYVYTPEFYWYVWFEICDTDKKLTTVLFNTSGSTLYKTLKKAIRYLRFLNQIQEKG